MAITAIHPYLIFNGTCEEAFAHYARVLGARNTGISRFSDMPPPAEGPPMPPEFANRVMNTAIQVGDLILMGSDCPPGMDSTGGNFSVSVQVTDEAEAERLFAGLMEGGGTIAMPMGETFWAKRFGMGTDRFGTPWMVNCSRDPA